MNMSSVLVASAAVSIAPVGVSALIGVSCISLIIRDPFTYSQEHSALDCVSRLRI